MLEFLQSLDAQAMYFLNLALRNPVFDMVMPWFHHGKYWITPLALIWLGLMIFGGKRTRLVCAGAIVMIVLTDQISSSVLKPLFERIRPCNVLPGLMFYGNSGWLLIPDPILQVYKSSYAMCSSHAANTGGQAFWWGWAYPRSRAPLGGLALLIGYSRVYNGVHYPGDVLVGWVVGFGAFMLLWLAVTKWTPRTEWTGIRQTTD